MKIEQSHESLDATWFPGKVSRLHVSIDRPPDTYESSMSHYTFYWFLDSGATQYKVSLYAERRRDEATLKGNMIAGVSFGWNPELNIVFIPGKLMQHAEYVSGVVPRRKFTHDN